MKAAYLLLSLFVLFATTSAASTPLASFLESYNISAATVNAFTSSNITYHSHAYTEFFLNSQPYLLVNTTAKQYSFVIGTPSIAAVINSSVVAESISALGINAIWPAVSAYLNTSATPINDCLAETGLDRATCTLSNLCQSCSFVPACNQVLQQTGGPSEAFGAGIIQFQAQYDALKANESLLISSTSNVTAGSLFSDSARINAAFSNVSAITQDIYENPIFPPPASVNLGNCNAIGSSLANASLANAPWYCNAVGFCEFTTYNYTKLAVIQNMINTLNKDMPTSSYVDSKAVLINNTESSIIVPLISAQKAKELSSALNVTLAGYGLTVNETASLLSHISNASLSASLSSLEAGYSNLKQNYLSLNISTAANAVSANLTAVSSLYVKAKPAYAKILGIAQNITALIIALQSGTSNPAVASIAFKEDALNAVVGGKISNTAAVTKNLTTVQADAKSLETINLNPAELSRSTDGPFTALLAPALGLTYPAAVASSPAFGALLSLIIGIIALSLLYGFHVYLKKKNKVKLNPRTRRAWAMLFGLVILIVIIFVALTYYYAAAANSSAYIASFENAVQSSKGVGIVLNGTTSPSMISCANRLYNDTVGLGKTAKIAYVSGAQCSIGGKPYTSSQCLNSFVASGTPFVVLTNSSTESIKAYSMYGTALYASGDASFMASCYPALFVK